MSTIKSVSTTRNKSKEGSEVPLSAKSEDANCENVEVSKFPQIVCQEDVIANFFNQIVEFAIKDMIVIEPVQEAEQEVPEGDMVVKDYRDLKSDDLSNAEIAAVSGTKVILKKSVSRASAKKTRSRLSTIKSSSKLAVIKKESSEKQRSKLGGIKESLVPSKLSIIQEESLEGTRSKTSTTVSSTLQDPLMEEEREVKIFFTTGNVYEGQIAKRTMNGKGKYLWADGTIYEGEFVDGFPTGKGEMTLPDLSNYKGGFNQGLFHGEGFLNIVSTPAFYSGQWKDGMKHGQGWLLYEPGNWYEGQWQKDLKEGFGLRCYKNGAKYRGTWLKGKCDGQGIMIWENNDYYKGNWSQGLMHGDGEYIWSAFYNKTLAFPTHNLYRGCWVEGKRCGSGTMHFGGDSGARLKGNWDQDFKHGDGHLICGNGIVLERPSLFNYDKPTNPLPHSKHILKVPVFTIPEEVEVGYYIDKILEKLPEEDQDNLKVLKVFEAKCVKNTIITFLPQLKELYKEYASMAATVKLHYEPVMVRMFLWQVYRDVEVHKLGLSLIDTDLILANNPNGAVEDAHQPFEPIYFWQFLMSLIGVALTTCSLDDDFESSTQGGVSAYIIKKFFEEAIFAKPPNLKGSLVFTHLDLVPIKPVYWLYQKLGEPHSARTFLRNTCTRKGEVPIQCHAELHARRTDPKSGVNFVPLADDVVFMSKESTTKLDEGARRHWSSLLDFRHIGPRNVIRCLGNVCPLIVADGLVVNMDYPLTFLEFYETLLACILMVLDLELKKEKKILLQNMETASAQARRRSSGSKTSRGRRKSGDSKKKGERKSSRSKKKSVS